MTTQPADLSARIGVAFALECRDAQGELLKTIPVTGAVAIPLTQTEDQKEAPDALDRSE
jgi:hypothetical protein